MKKYTSIISLVLAFGFYAATAQIDNFEYKRTIKTKGEVWNKIALPDNVFEKLNPLLEDIRIYGVTDNNDTLEAPYLLKKDDVKIASKEINYQIINTSKNEKGYYYTLLIPNKELINYLKLNFLETNFDWLVDVEGSQDQKEWFQVLKEQRILAINNEKANFSYTELNFPNASYAFLRIRIQSKTAATLQSAKVLKTEPVKPNNKEYTVLQTKITNNKKEKTTEILVELQDKVPVSELSIQIANQHSFYRPMDIQYLADSVKTPKGWHYNFLTISQSLLNSELPTSFSFEHILTKKIKITIYNSDNTPLKINSIAVKGIQYYLLARLTDKANYYLCYGNQTIQAADYDINKGNEEIPDTINSVEIGNETKTNKIAAPKTEAMIQNMVWLWVLMGVAVILLGIFSYKMLRK